MSMPQLCLCTLLPLLGTPPTTATPCFLSKPAIANIVGYTSQPYVGGKWLIGATPFQDTTGASFSLNNLVSGFVTTDATVDTLANMMVNNPYIQIQNRNANGTLASGNKNWFFCADAYLDEDGLVTGPAWADEDGCAAGGPYNPNVKIPAGAGFWFKDPNAAVTITWPL